MRIGSLLMTILGLGVAGVSVFAARDLIEIRKADAAPGAPGLVQVIVASRDIGFGQAIDGQSLTSIAWPRDAVPGGTYSDYTVLLPATGQPARRAKRNIAQGELILASKVSDFGEKVTIVQTLGANQRAMAIKVNAETAVGGFVTPGDAVDVLLTQGRDENLRAITILQNIRVIGVDQEADEQKDMPEVARTVTVAVTPDEGQRLALAQEAGTLSLTLRTVDQAAVDEPLDSVRLSDLIRDKSPVPETAPKKSIVVRRGTEVTTETK